MIKIRKGLDLPLAGDPQQAIHEGARATHVALVGYDYHGMKPTMEVAVGDTVKRGQVVFTDKKNEGVKYTAPAAGEVVEINRGDKRVFQSLVIKVAEQEDDVTFSAYSEEQLGQLDRQTLVDALVESGLWTALRTRPFSRVPAIDSTPHSIFVSLMDTQPLAADPAVIVADKQADFLNGLKIITKLTDGKVFLCARPNANLPLIDDAKIQTETFDGPHPAGNVGTHIHFLDPVHNTKKVWTLGYQDVIAFGAFFTSGKLPVERVVALAGPRVNNPRLLRTRIGANLVELTEGELEGNHNRMISGSVFGGRTANGPLAYLGRYANQITVIEEGDKRELFGWLSPGTEKFSKLNIYLSRFSKGKKFAFNSSTNGSERAMVPVGAYEDVMPLDILPTQLLRSLIVGDTQTAQLLGCLELDEEDLALCTYVCPGKYEYGPILRQNLTRIEKEG